MAIVRIHKKGKGEIWHRSPYLASIDRISSLQKREREAGVCSEKSDVLIKIAGELCLRRH